MTIENNTEQAGGVVDVLAHVDATPDRVWRSFMDGDELSQWYWPASLRPSAEVDARVGGRYRIASAAMPMAVSGEYLELADGRRAVMSWQWDGEDAASTVELTVEPAGSGTDVRVVHTGLADEARPAHAQGWTDCLGRLPAHLAGAG